MSDRLNWKSVPTVDGEPVTERGKFVVIKYNSIVDVFDYDKFLEDSSAALAEEVVSVKALTTLLARSLNDDDFRDFVNNIRDRY